VDRPNRSHARMLEQRPDVGTPMAANLTCKSRLQIRQADVIAPAGVDHDWVPALIIGAIDDEPGRAGLPHFSEGNLSLALHESMVAPAPGVETTAQRAGAVAASELSTPRDSMPSGPSSFQGIVRAVGDLPARRDAGAEGRF
jgi:hypothetical protein